MQVMEIVIVILLGLVLAALAVLITRKPADKTDSVNLLKQDLTNLSVGMDKLRDGLGERLDKQNTQMQKSMTSQLGESAKLIESITKKLTKLDETNKRVVDVADELKTLQNVLSNPKQRGVLGEYYLQTVLENVLPTSSFKMQYTFEDGQAVDAAVFVDRGKIIPIDSKFSLENYNRLVESEDKAERDKLAALIKSDLKKRIDETAKYIRPEENTLEISFMFIPSEAIYYDLIINEVGATTANARDLVQYAFQDKKVIIVSPTTLLAYLQTVLQGLRSLQIEEQAKDIQKRVGLLGRHITKFEDVMQRLGKSLGTTVNHYNSAHKELNKIDKDVVKITEGKPSVDPVELDKPRTDD